jgi:hypothetical protein
MESIRLGEIKREFLCCEKYYASINLQLLKIIKRKLETQTHLDDSFSYKTAALTMLSNMFHDSYAISDLYGKHEFYDEDKFKDRDNAADHLDFVLDLLKPLDEKIQIKVSHCQGI